MTRAASPSHETSARRVRSTSTTRSPFEDLPNRALLCAMHPVVTTDFQFPTPPLVRAVDLMLHIIASGAPGCAFVAFPRFGKTYAIAYCRHRLPEVFPTIPIFAFHAHGDTPPNARSFFSDLLKQSGYLPKRGATAPELRDQLVRAWWVETLSREASRLILFGDEMQRLSANEFTGLIDVSNDLQKLGVRMTSILFGQPELASRRSTFLATHRGDILGRFMSRWCPFDGIASARELREVFACYDDPAQAQYPGESGYCYTKFFLPQAYERGWRLASCAGLCWELFTAQARSRLEPRFAKKISIGMEWVAGAVQYALTHYSDYDRPQFSISAQEWKIAIESTGFAESLGLTYHPAWAAKL